MKKFCPLASGSKGNSIYLETEEKKVLIDFGITPKYAQEALSKIGVDLQEIDAIFISHEHSDHIKGLETLSLPIPVIASRETAKVIYRQMALDLPFKLFTSGEPFIFGDLKVMPFQVHHDTIDPVGFRMESGGYVIGVCTDLGHVTPIVKHYLEGVCLLYIEANHDPSMVHACSRPNVYKQRVLSRQGHLSNSECARLIFDLWHEGLEVVYLAHLSSECNSPVVARREVEEALSTHKLPLIHIALQDQPSPVTSFIVI